MKQMERIRCTSCGADFEDYDPEAKVMQCTRLGCGATFVIDQGKQFDKVQVDHEEEITKLRKLLNQAIEARDALRMADYATKIRVLIPDDALAGFCEALGQKRRGRQADYGQHLQQAGFMTREDADQIFTLALEEAFFTMHDVGALERFMHNQFPTEEQEAYRQRLSQAIDRLAEASNRYAIIPRDVFICHSSDDAIAREVEEMLRKDGVKCWISSRNLPPDTIYYWDHIFKALASCKIILVIASRSSMLKNDPVREMEYARERGMKRLEFKVDDYEHTVFFKHFFDGISWVKLKEDKEASFAELRERVYHLLHEQKETVRVAEKTGDKVPLRVRYIDERSGKVLNEETVMLHDGWNSVRPNHRYVPPQMAVTGRSDYEVQVRGGKADPSKITFRLSREVRTIVIHYKRRQDGRLLAKEERIVSSTDELLKPDMDLIPDEYTLKKADGVELKPAILESGEPIVFQLDPKTDAQRVETHQVKIQYVEQYSKKLLKTEYRLLHVGQHLLKPDWEKVPEGYRALTGEMREVNVGQGGAVPQTINFLCNQLEEGINELRVQYLDIYGNTVAPFTKETLSPGQHMVSPKPTASLADYRTIGPQQLNVTVQKGKAPLPVSFRYLHRTDDSKRGFVGLILGILLVAWVLIGANLLLKCIDPGALERQTGVNLHQHAAPLNAQYYTVRSQIATSVGEALDMQTTERIKLASDLENHHFIIGTVLLLLLSMFRGPAKLYYKARSLERLNMIFFAAFGLLWPMDNLVSAPGRMRIETVLLSLAGAWVLSAIVKRMAAGSLAKRIDKISQPGKV